MRNGRFYAQLTVIDPETGRKVTQRIALAGEQSREPVRTAAEAVAALACLKVQRADHALPVIRKTPTLTDYVDQYFSTLPADAKRRSTIEKERSILRRWCAAIGSLRLNQIRIPHIRAFVAGRQQEGMGARTANLDVIALRNVFKMGVEDGYLKEMPTAGMKLLKVKTARRELFTLSDVERVIAAALEPLFLNGRPARQGETGKPLKNARQLGDYLKLLCYSGARRNEALALRWRDVDFAQGQLTIGADGGSKNGRARVVDFNACLEGHLRDMEARRAPDVGWLFPSPQRGKRDINASTLRESFNLAREAASRTDPRLAEMGFHSCRHLFVSMGVMAGIDFMTLAGWVGHQDGGVLIGKVYGHIANQHKKRQAARLNFEPVIERGVAA